MGNKQAKGTVYLAGKITGDPGYFLKFYEAKKVLEAAGYIVLSGILLPGKGFEWEQYIRMTAAMLEECETACFLPDWKESRGAMYEYGRATARGKRIMLYEEWIAEQEAAREMLKDKGDAE
jgi:nucleoside 2-deoxyribosyltransferase